MEQTATDKSVRTEIESLHSTERLILRETTRAITPFGGVAVFMAYLGKIGFVGKIREHMPIRWRSPNHIDPTATFTAFLMAVLVGARRFAHANWLRGDRALQTLLGMSRFPCDDTIRNLFRQFGMGNVQRLFAPLIEWQMERLPVRTEGYSLDLDSTVFERYGRQEGSLKGHNPRKHGRPSHHPLLAVLAEARFLLHGWLRSGNCGSSRGVVAFLEEALVLLSHKRLAPQKGRQGSCRVSASASRFRRLAIECVSIGAPVLPAAPRPVGLRLWRQTEIESSRAG